MTTTKNPIQEQITKELKTAIGNISGPLMNDIADVSGRLPENIFVEYFLPRIFYTDRYPRNEWVGQWVAVAGSYTRPIAILDSNTMDYTRPLYYAPPIMLTAGVVSLGRRAVGKNLEPGFIHANEQKELITRISPNKAANFENTFLNQMLQKHIGNDNPEIKKLISAWISIFKRYNYPVGDIDSENTTNNFDDLSDLIDE